MFDIYTKKNLYKYGTIFDQKCSIYILTKIGINIEQFLIKKCLILQKTCINIGNRNIGQKTANMIDIPIFIFGISGIGITGSG